MRDPSDFSKPGRCVASGDGPCRGAAAADAISPAVGAGSAERRAAPARDCHPSLPARPPAVTWDAGDGRRRQCSQVDVVATPGEREATGGGAGCSQVVVVAAPGEREATG